MQIISIRENPEYTERAIAFFQKTWASVSPIIYDDCINHAVGSIKPLPQWYLLIEDEKIIGCAGLVTNDFISRMDLYPWICALFIDENYRGNNYGYLLIEKAQADAKKSGFDYIYLCTSHVGYYERFGFNYLGQGYHPWNEESRIYSFKL